MVHRYGSQGLTLNYAQDTALRDVWRQHPPVKFEVEDTKGRTKFLHVFMAEYIAKAFNVRTMRDNNEMLIYNDKVGVYVPRSETYIAEIMARWMRERYTPCLVKPRHVRNPREDVHGPTGNIQPSTLCVKYVDSEKLEDTMLETC